MVFDDISIFSFQDGLILKEGLRIRIDEKSGVAG
jgi:hypothetical protein